MTRAGPAVAVGVALVATLAAVRGRATDAGAEAGASDPFVRARGNRLELGGAPFRFAGANLAIMHHPENRTRAEEILTEAARDGVRVGRIWALGEGAETATTWQRDNFLFRAGPEGWISAAPEQLDRVLEAARRAGVRLIITLSNNWPDYGGVPQYLRWAGAWREDAYGAQDRFYSDRRARADFRAHLERLVGRTNQLTGRPYRDDPTIMAWELMNESAVATAEGAVARRQWIVEMARAIHALDPNHLVMPGVSMYRLGRERRDWLDICRLPEIDVCDGHIYPESMLGERGPEVLDAMIDDFVQLSRHVAGKPFILGELGISESATGVWQGQPRSYWLSRIFGRLADDGAAGGLVWVYQPQTDPKGHGIGVGAGDARATEVRRAMRNAAARMAAAPPDGNNPQLGPERGDAELNPLQAEVEGPNALVPVLPSGRRARVTWDPPTYARSKWEASGVWAGGEVVHLWGTETGWFEYAFELLPGAAPVELAAVTVRARVSSEYPGTLSPPGGVSAFTVSLDGVPLGRAIAPRDDGRGRWITVRSSARALRAALRRPGRHVVRFTVTPGPRAHGLCLYGGPGEKPGAPLRTGPIQLEIEAAP